MQGSIMGLWLTVNYGQRGLLASLCILFLSWAVEHMGVTTGFPFGGYHYTDTLNLKVLGVVPLAVPFAWLLVIPTAIGITEYLVARREHEPLKMVLPARLVLPTLPEARAFLSSLVRDPESTAATNARLAAQQPGMLAAPASHGRGFSGDVLIKVLGAASLASFLDLMIEPVAVDINGYWVWNNSGGGYYGVPGSNFAAWWVTSVLLVALLFLLIRSAGFSTSSTPARLYPWLPPLLYTLNLTMFVLVTLAHGKLLAVGLGCLMLGYLAFAWLQPRLVHWIMGESRSTLA
jgi:putative membrane protein